jgi:hypothetical protein
MTHKKRSKIHSKRRNRISHKKYNKRSTRYNKHKKSFRAGSFNDIKHKLSNFFSKNKHRNSIDSRFTPLNEKQLYDLYLQQQREHTPKIISDEDFDAGLWAFQNKHLLNDYQPHLDALQRTRSDRRKKQLLRKHNNLRHGLQVDSHPL